MEFELTEIMKKVQYVIPINKCAVQQKACKNKLFLQAFKREPISSRHSSVMEAVVET